MAKRIISFVLSFILISSCINFSSYNTKALGTQTPNKKMIIISATQGSIANVFIPIDYKEFTGEAYAKLTFKAKLFGDSKPIVGVIRSDYGGVGSYSEPRYADNGLDPNDEFPRTYSEYDPQTMTFTAVIRLWYTSPYEQQSTGAFAAITIGNAEHNGPGVSEHDYSVAFAFADPVLKLLDDYGNEVTENLIADINDNTLNFGTTYKHTKNPDRDANNIMFAPAQKWSIDTTAKFIAAYDIPDGYFDPDYDGSNNKMLRLAGDGRTQHAISFQANLQPGETYRFDMDYRSYNGAIEYIVAQVKGSSGSYAAISPNYCNQSYTPDHIDGLHVSYTFTVPSDAALNTDGNFRLYLGDQYYNKQMGTIYYANIQLRKVYPNGSMGVNVFPNGNFCFGEEGPINQNVHLAAWKVENLSKYDDVRVMKIPDGFFNQDLNYKTDKALKMYGGDFHSLRITSCLKSNTKYRLSYNYRCVGEQVTVTLQEYLSNGNYAPTRTLENNNLLYTNPDGTVEYKQTFEFITNSSLYFNNNDNSQNVHIRFNTGQQGYDKLFYIANVELYELDAMGNKVGHNILGDFNPIYRDEVYAGLNAVGDEIKVLLNSDYSTAVKRLIAHCWLMDVGSTDSPSENYASLVKIPENFFEYKTYDERVEMIENVLLGLTESDNNPYYDPNNDGVTDIKDIEYTIKKQSKQGFTGGADDLASQLKTTIRNSGNTQTQGTVYYVANSGNNSNSGKSENAPLKTLEAANSKAKLGDTILFKRGDVWRINPSSTSGFTLKAGVTYGAYGTGDKPLFIGSAYNYATRTWTYDGNNVWKTDLRWDRDWLGRYDVHDANQVGNVYLFTSNNSEPITGVSVAKYVNGQTVYDKSDLDAEGEFYIKPNTENDGFLYLYCTQNPATKYARIELAEKRDVFKLANNVKLDNLCIKFAGGHGINGIGLNNVTITNCELGYIGGAPHYSNRYGNGIQFGNGGKNLRIENCYVYQCFDAGITFQSWSDNTEFDNVSFVNNLLENNYYNIEFFTTGTSEYKVGSSNSTNGIMKNITIQGNIMRFAGYCWSYNQRLSDGNFRCANIAVTKNAYYINTQNLKIINNIFDCTKSSHVYWTWKDVTANVDKTAHVGLTVYGNTFYQKLGATDSRCMMFGNVGNYTYASSLYGLTQGVALFDSNPADVFWLDTIK
ncbi:MAG: right-handed parallel beta-helix repeat-containing protein [Clostridiaceae bacterium]|nr:right-handed parallel beta-helix repeat-containing protein [Clostridiaceae bacterium]